VDGYVIFLLAATACTTTIEQAGEKPGPETTSPPVATVVAELRADSNRDGEVRFDESDADRATWDATRGAVFLANIDDDTSRCDASGDDVDLDKCNDAADDVVNGADDVLDLAKLATKPWPAAPDGATAVVDIASANGAEHVRLFKRTGAGATDFEVLAPGAALTTDELRAGVELAIEGKDVVRDPSEWDGYVDVRLTVTAAGEKASDVVRMRVAPLVTYHHLLPAEQIFVSDTRTAGNRAMRNDLASACEAAKAPAPELIADPDPWTQDFFETAYMSMPAAGGKQHAIHVSMRSANVFEPSDARNPLRPAGAVVFTSFRGKDSAGVQQFTRTHSPKMDTLNSFGNLETVPPYSHAGKSFPFGRILRGKTPTFYPDETFTTMIEGQAIQPPIDVDTSWLAVGHIDETVSFVKAKTPRGWALLVNDAPEARKMLEDAAAAGHGNVPVFAAKKLYDERGRPYDAETTIAKVLADTEVMSASAEAAAEVAAQVAVLKKETGLTDAEIVKIPFLHTSYGGLSAAYIPGMVNGIYIADDHFVAPKPHGPVIGGEDIFEKVVRERLAALGITAHFAEDWDDYHAGVGEVHCGTNTRRRIPDAKWWESGR